MQGTIQYISPLQAGRNGGSYHLVTFLLEDGRSAKTYLDPANRNFRNWKPILNEGVILTGLVQKKTKVIDADSPIRPVS